MSAESTAYNITNYVVDAVTVSALAIDDCLNDNDIHYCTDELYQYLKNSNYTVSTCTIATCSNTCLLQGSISMKKGKRAVENVLIQQYKGCLIYDRLVTY